MKHLLFSLALIFLSGSLFAQKHEGETVEGKYVGTHTWYHENGKKQAEVVYSESGMAQSFKTWTEEGFLMDDVRMNMKRELQGMPDLDWNKEEDGFGFVLLPDERSVDEPKPILGDKVYVHYEGYLQDGTVFDSSFDRKPLKYKFDQKQVIPGFDRAVAMLKVGDSGWFYIPSDQGYAEMVAGEIPPHSNLIYKIKLVDLKSGLAPK